MGGDGDSYALRFEIPDSDDWLATAQPDAEQGAVMNVKPIPQETLEATTLILKAFVPGLSADRLIAALEAYDESSVKTEPEAAENALPRYLTKEEVADAMQVCTRTVIRMAESGRLEGGKFAGQWRFPPEAIEKAMKKPSK